MVSTVDTLIYAIGGGHGHARRGWLLQRAMAEQGTAPLLLVRPGSDRNLPPGPGPRLHGRSLTEAGLRAVAPGSLRRIVVDTFAAGWQGDLDARSLARFDQRVLIARYLSPPIAAPVPYERVIAPYPAKRCEWQGKRRGLTHAGYLLDGSHLQIDSCAGVFAVFDPESRCAPRLRAAFARAARRAGLVCRFYDSMVRRIQTRKLLVVGAGYHTFYETISRGVDVRFLPVKKRYDDQARRTQLFGLAIRTLDELPGWLAAPELPVAEATPCDPRAWCDLLKA
jgi:hypothetical protein